MQIVKPRALGLSTRPVEFRKRFGLCISACLHLPFVQAERGTLWAEQSMWDFLGREMARPMIDEGVAKLTPEFLVSGHAYPPGGVPAAACAVRARVGALEKVVLVFGDRHWQGDRPSAPAPFATMPLTAARSYGGSDFAANPAGRGRMAEGAVRWLPNLELPADRVVRPDQAVVPAVFGPLDITHPQRVQWRGTYDERYLHEHAPGFAPDTDWRTFNLAPTDQWFAAPLVGDEAFTFENMHPEQPVVQGRLPGLRARAFAGYGAGAEARVREVPLRLTTLWFFPHALRCVAIFHGLAECGTDDGSDVTSLLGAVERLGEPRDDAHYLACVERRADSRLGAVHALTDDDLLPDGVETQDPDVEAAQAPFATEGLQAEAQYRRAALDVEMAREKAVAMGQDPDALGIVMPVRDTPPKGAALAPWLQARLAEAEAQQWKAVEQAVGGLELVFGLADANKVSPADLVHRGPPVYRAAGEFERLRAAGAPQLETLRPKLQAVEESQRAGYLQGAHLQPPARRRPPGQDDDVREQLRQAAARGLRCFFGADFTGADLSGLDLRGMDFTEAWLESVDLRGANVSGARFERAVLAHADLSGATAIGADFRRANLGASRWAGGVFDDADFRDATLMRARLGGSQARRARFARASMLETEWSEGGLVDWSEADMSSTTLHELGLAGVVWTGATLSGCTLTGCDLRGADLRGARMTGTTFVTCALDGARLAGVDAVGAVAVKDCSAAGTDWRGARLQRFNFGGSDLRRACFAGARLDGANLSEAWLEDADLMQAVAPGALWRRARLARANLGRANLRDGVLQHADLRGADLRASNLFGADLSRVRLDGSTRFDGALLSRARTWPRLTREQQEAGV